MKRIPLLIAVLYAIPAHAYVYNIIGTEFYVNGMPPNLTKTDKAMYLDRVNIGETDLALIENRATFIDTKSARQEVLKLKDVIVEPPPVDPPPVEPPPVEPPVEPPHNHGNMPMVDETKNMIPAVGFSDLRLKPQTYAPGAAGGSSTGGDFRITCNASHMGVYDPIVYFGQIGVPHHHTFFGNTTTNPFSTTDLLKATGNSTCFGGIANRSAYWVPSLINTINNAPIKPDWALFYYKGGDVKPPNGLVILAGDMSANPNKQQSLDVIDWQCHQPNGNSYQEWLNRKNYIPACSADLTATVKFPACWNGVDLDSPDHKSHMSYYNESGQCPAGYPKNIPDITYAIHYNVNGTAGLRLSSDNYIGGNGGHSLHGDYMFAWDDDVLDTWFTNCNGADRDCHANLNGAGLELY